MIKLKKSKREHILPLKKGFPVVILAITIASIFQSCYSTKRYQYFQDLTDSSNNSIPINDYNFNLKFLPLDEININVTSAIPALAAPFNLTNTTTVTNYMGNAGSSPPGAIQPAAANIANPIKNSFKVDLDGDIDYPFIGKLHVQGKTVQELKDTLTDILRKRFVKDATVDVRLADASVTVMGEVKRAGRVTLPSEKTSIIDAILASGDFTDYSNRKDVILIREVDGKKQVYHIDLRKSDVFRSKYYYLRQNDIVFVKPTKDKGFLNDPYTRSIMNYVYMIGGLVGFLYLIKR